MKRLYWRYLPYDTCYRASKHGRKAIIHETDKNGEVIYSIQVEDEIYYYGFFYSIETAKEIAERKLDDMTITDGWKSLRG